MTESGWAPTRLKYVVEVNTSTLPEDTKEDFEFIYVDISNVTQGSMNTATDLVKFREAPSRARREAAAGDTVISTVRTYLRAIATVPESDETLIFSTGFAVLHPHGVDPGFLSWYLQGDEFVARVEASSTGVSYPAITARQLIDLDLRIPPLAEQHAIADFLDRETARIDTLIEEQQRLIDLLRERRQSEIDVSFEPDERWTRTSLKHCLDGVDQGVSPQAEAGLADTPGSWGVLKSGCVNRGVFRQEEHKRLADDFAVNIALAISDGDLIVSRASGSPDLVGSAAIVGKIDYNLILSDKLFRLRPSHSTSSVYLYWFLNSRHYRMQVRRAISGADGLANNLPLSALRNFEMAIPTLNEQRRIAASLDEKTSAIDAVVVEAEKFIELVRERRAALITAAVTGQIDVRDEVA